MRRIINDITKGKDLQDNLAKYVSQMKSYHYKYAMVRLALIYYTYYQVVEEEEESTFIGHKDISDKVNHIIRDALIGDLSDISESLQELEECRKTILADMEALTYYVDAFRLHEHALNRVEYRFKEEAFPDNYSDEQLCRTLMQYILSDEDNVVINSKISEVMAELPIKLTKNKFFEYLSNGLSIYKGSEKKSLDDFLYMIKTTSMIDGKEEYKERFPELEELLEDLQKTDYSSVTEDDYNSMARAVEEASVFMKDVMNTSMMLMEIMNAAYAILLSEKSAEEDKVVHACVEIITAVNDYFILGSQISEETEDMFVLLEGTQENIYQKINLYNVVDQIEATYGLELDKYCAKEGIEDIKVLSILCSDSIFVDINPVNDTSLVDEEVLKAEEDKIISQFREKFETNGKSINRAVMAAVMAQLPVFFNNISELQDFIYNTLSGCMDKAEKLACIEVLHQIMEE
ncbi:MAG: hypothetical protein IKN54_04065 [Lachnospiraceae bacterium]|nr:hypothetical protein [Lachnospiraceae bacterium]